MGALALAGLGLKASFEATAQPRGESLDHLTYPNLAHPSATTKKDTHIDRDSVGHSRRGRVVRKATDLDMLFDCADLATGAQSI
jgi:hypothetical protein